MDDFDAVNEAFEALENGEYETEESEAFDAEGNMRDEFARLMGF